jgi:pimeloyl-ACP methyl ester carboxylesterase
MRDLTFDVRGLKLHAVERGEGPLTLLLHGWLDHAGSFDLLAPLLPGRTVALDFRGHGDSAWVGPGGFYHFVDYLQDIDGALDALQADEVRIVGHSMGGAAGLLYAAVRPSRVKRLVLLDGAPLSIALDELPARTTAFLDDLRIVKRARRRVGSVEEAAERMARTNAMLSPSTAALMARGAVSPDPQQEGALAWKWDPLLRAHSPLPYVEEAIQAVVGTVAAPVLAVRAETGLLPEEDVFRTRFPRLDLRMHTLPGSTHHVHLDQPEACAELIKRFL